MNVTDPVVKREASRKVSLEPAPPPYGPGTPTGFTNRQQAALYFARKRRREVLGVLPGPPVGPAALSIANRLFTVPEGTPAGTILGTLQVIGGTGTYTFTKTADPSSKFSLAGGVLSTAGTWDYEAARFYQCTIRADNGAGSQLDRVFSFGLVDISEPAISGQSLVKTGSTTATAQVTTDQADGTLYFVLTASNISPSAAQVKAGQDQTGAAALKAANQVITTVGAKSFNLTAITAGTRYGYFMHERLPAEQSVIAGTAGVVFP